MRFSKGADLAASEERMEKTPSRESRCTALSALLTGNAVLLSSAHTPSNRLLRSMRQSRLRYTSWQKPGCAQKSRMACSGQPEGHFSED